MEGRELDMGCAELWFGWVGSVVGICGIGRLSCCVSWVGWFVGWDSIFDRLSFVVLVVCSCDCIGRVVVLWLVGVLVLLLLEWLGIWLVIWWLVWAELLLLRWCRGKGVVLLVY
jgi:hypothetical protein